MLTAIAILIFIAWFASAWVKPGTAFSYLPFALPFYLLRLNIGPLPTTALEMAALGMIAGWVVHEAWGGKLVAGSFRSRLPDAWPAIRPWMLPCGLWLLAGAISVFIAPDHLAALGLFRAYFVEPVAIFFVGLGLMSKEEGAGTAPLRGTIVRNIAIVTIFFGIWAIFQRLTGIGLPEDYAPLAIRRSVGPFPYPNALALFVTPVAVLAFVQCVAAIGRVKRDGNWRLEIGKKEQSLISNLQSPLLACATVAAGLTSILLAKSDGGLIAFLAGAFVILIMNKRTRIAAFAVAAICAIAIAAIPAVRTPVMNQLLFKEWSGKVRVIMWKETYTMLKDRPIFGAGLSAYPTAIKPYHKATWMEIFQYPHNILLNLWSETGSIGVVAFGWILWGWAYGLRLTAYGQKDPVAVSLQPFAVALPVITALLVHGLVDVPYFKNDLAILFFLLILVTSTNTETMKQ